MKYKQLILQKLSIVENYLMGVDSMVSGHATKLEVKNRLEQIKELVVEIESLISKEN